MLSSISTSPLPYLLLSNTLLESLLTSLGSSASPSPRIPQIDTTPPPLSSTTSSPFSRSFSRHLPRRPVSSLRLAPSMLSPDSRFSRGSSRGNESSRRFRKPSIPLGRLELEESWFGEYPVQGSRSWWRLGHRVCRRRLDELSSGGPNSIVSSFRFVSFREPAPSRLTRSYFDLPEHTKTPLNGFVQLFHSILDRIFSGELFVSLSLARPS